MPSAVLLAVVLAAAAGGEPRAALSRALDDEIQTTLPGEHAAAGRSTRLPPVHEGKPPTVVQPPAGAGALGRVVSIVVWCLAGAGVLLIAVYLVRERLGARQKPLIVGPPPAEAATPEAEVPLGDAEALAAGGRYREAIHTLLLSVVRHLAGRGGALSRALTSREIVSRVSLSPEARAALAELVSAVEVSHFGDVEPGPSEWEQCRRRFAVVAGALRP